MSLFKRLPCIYQPLGRWCTHAKRTAHVANVLELWELIYSQLNFCSGEKLASTTLLKQHRTVGSVFVVYEKPGTLDDPVLTEMRQC